MKPEEKAAAARTGAAAVSAVSSTVEEVSAAVRKKVRAGLSPLGSAAAGPMAAVDATHAGVHATIRVGSKVVGEAAALALQATADPEAPALVDTPRGSTTLAVLGAAFGDRLPEPLAPNMSLRLAEDPGGTQLVVFVHGLGGHDEQFSQDYADAFVAAGFTVGYVRYTSGRSIDDTAAELSGLLAEVDQGRSEPFTRIVLVGHSMGGLVIIAALHGGGDGVRWIPRVSDVVTLGTPHTGAPLERVSDAALRALATSEIVAPIAAVGHTRSQGIKDLAHGVPQTVPDDIRHTAVVAALGESPDAVLSRTLGDGIVPVPSARGRAPEDPHVTLVEVSRADHLSLLARDEVTEVLREVVA